MSKGTKLSAWMPVPGSPHCCMRIIEGGDPESYKDRFAFIEKTPRVRIVPFGEKAEMDSWDWGPKGAGGADGHDPKNELYGYYPPSRQWCDAKLLEMGYLLADA